MVEAYPLVIYNLSFVLGDPLYVGFDLTIASFDSISEVSMVGAHT